MDDGPELVPGPAVDPPALGEQLVDVVPLDLGHDCASPSSGLLVSRPAGVLWLSSSVFSTRVAAAPRRPSAGRRCSGRPPRPSPGPGRTPPGSGDRPSAGAAPRRSGGSWRWAGPPDRSCPPPCCRSRTTWSLTLPDGDRRDQVLHRYARVGQGHARRRSARRICVPALACSTSM